MKYSFWGLALLCLSLSFFSCENQDSLDATPCRYCLEDIAESAEFLAYQTAVNDLFTTVALNQVDMKDVESLLIKEPNVLDDELTTEARMESIKGGPQLFGQMKQLREARINLQANYDYFTLGKEKQHEVDRLFAKQHPENSSAELSQRILLSRAE